jgi:predicted double-glycine peptidase
MDVEDLNLGGAEDLGLGAEMPGGEASGWTDPTPDPGEDPWGDPVLGSLDDGPVVGSPEEDSEEWVHQTTDYTCAVVSQEMILHEYGIEVSEEELMDVATEHGWLSPGGTSLEDMAQLLEYYGVESHMEESGDFEDLMRELAQGHKVIVAVDSGEIWGGDASDGDVDGADHAVVVTGIDMSDPDNPMVIVNDPGDPSGAGKAYPLEEFLDAWRDSDCRYVATDEPPPDVATGAYGANYDASAGMYMNSAFWMAMADRIRGRAS